MCYEPALSMAEPELIAACVRPQRVPYCHGVHSVTAKAFGIEEHIIRALIEDIEAAPVDRKAKPLLRVVKKLTHLPSPLTNADGKAVYAAGWTEKPLHDAVSARYSIS